MSISNILDNDFDVASVICNSIDFLDDGNVSVSTNSYKQNFTKNQIQWFLNKWSRVSGEQKSFDELLVFLKSTKLSNIYKYFGYKNNHNYLMAKSRAKHKNHYVIKNNNAVVKTKQKKSTTTRVNSTKKKNSNGIFNELVSNISQETVNSKKMAQKWLKEHKEKHDAGKIPIRIDSKTIVLCTPQNVEKWMKKIKEKN